MKAWPHYLPAAALALAGGFTFLLAAFDPGLVSGCRCPGASPCSCPAVTFVPAFAILGFFAASLVVLLLTWSIRRGALTEKPGVR